MNRVLVVEDEEPMLSDLVREFRENGFEAVGCRDPDEAVEAARNAVHDGRPFSLAVLDIRFDDVGDRSRYHRTRPLALSDDLRKISGSLPIVMVTGDKAAQKPSSRNTALKSGSAVSYLLKPLDPEDVVAQAQAILLHLDQVLAGISGSQDALTSGTPGSSGVPDVIDFRVDVSRNGAEVTFGFTLDVASGRMAKDGEPVMLAPSEFRVLRLLLLAEGQVVLRGTFRKSPRDGGCGFAGGDGTNDPLTQAVASLRKKLGVTDRDRVIVYLNTPGVAEGNQEVGGYIMNFRPAGPEK